ncbi:MAG TPA: hypothetical protein VFZ83_05380 [Acidimicrobiia bacterium]|nr:hypothetical protein [Acidimicrobiia bacterium]
MSPRATATPERFVQQVTAAIERELEVVVREHVSARGSLDQLGDPRALARRMLALVPEASAWNDVLGPFYATRGATTVLGGITRQALAERRARRTVVALRTADDEWVYPLFQFGDREVLPGVADAWQALDGIDDWTAAALLVAPQRALDGATAIGWLAAGRPVDTVVSLLRSAAARLTR